jgi:DNA invertase Pin-like site-specific DNA recombinase
MPGVFAEFETNLRRERQLEGIAKAKTAGVYKGRPASIDAARVRELKAGGMGPTQIEALKIGRASVYRVLEERAGLERSLGMRKLRKRPDTRLAAAGRRDRAGRVPAHSGHG